MTQKTYPKGCDPRIFSDYRDFGGQTHIAALWRLRIQELGDQPAHREKHYGIWQSYSWNDFWTAVERLSAALKFRGFQEGDVLSILSENRKEWAYVDMAVQCLGGQTVGIYQTDAPSQCAYIIKDSSTKFLFIENDEQLDKFLKIEDRCPNLDLLCLFDRKGLGDFKHAKMLFWEDLLREGQDRCAKGKGFNLDAEIDARDPGAVALLVYTSGTTGPPKGAQLTGRNIISSGKAVHEMFGDQAGEVQFSFLPLAHIWERINALYLPLFLRSIVAYAESPETIFDNMRDISPRYLTGVPRVWEKVHSSINLRLSDATRLGKAAYNWAIRQGEARADYAMEGKPAPAAVRLRYGLADALVLANIRRAIGMDRVKRANSGAAPISPKLLKWFWALGVPIYEGWGQSETMALGTLNRPGNNRVGTIGKPTPQARMRIDPETSEIQIAGPHVFQGYVNLPEKTAEAFTEDGWLRSGDMGRMDEDGYISIIGRIKDVIITAGGKNITPTELENDMKCSPYISDALVIGEGRKYLTALIMIDQDNVEKFAQDASIPFSNFASLCVVPEVVKLIEAEVAQVNANYARAEQIKKLRLIDQRLQGEDEELTPTMKLKRSFVEKKYAGLVDSMY